MQFRQSFRASSSHSSIYFYLLLLIYVKASQNNDIYPQPSEIASIKVDRKNPTDEQIKIEEDN